MAEFSAGVEAGQHQLDGGHFEFLVHVHGNTAAVVSDGDGAIHVHGYFDLRAVSGEVLIDGVVEDFENTVVETTLIGIADVHPGTLADGIKAFEFIDLSRVVFLLGSDLGLGFFRLVFFL